jgi:hypothetical protein
MINILDKIQLSIACLEMSGSIKENIIITTSFLYKPFFEELLNVKIKKEKNYIFGCEFLFNHFKNEIVIYDKTKACLNKNFLIKIEL